MRACVCAYSEPLCCHRFLWQQSEPQRSSEPRDTPTHSGSLRIITQSDPAASLCHRLPTSCHRERGRGRGGLGCLQLTATTKYLCRSTHAGEMQAWFESFCPFFNLLGSLEFCWQSSCVSFILLCYAMNQQRFALAW